MEYVIGALLGILLCLLILRFRPFWVEVLLDDQYLIDMERRLVRDRDTAPSLTD